MGWNANTSTLTTPSIISDLVPTASGTSGKGYQITLDDMRGECGLSDMAQGHRLSSMERIELERKQRFGHEALQYVVYGSGIR